MSVFNSKIKKKAGQAIDSFEEKVATYLYELQANSDKLKSFLREVHINRAVEVDVDASKKAVVIFVPVPQLAQYQRMIKEKDLIDELEKKFSGQNVIVVAQRTILRKETRNARNLKQKRPRSRTLTAVQDSILEDLVYPTEIVGKRIRVRPDGSRLLKVHLQPEREASVKDKVDTFAAVYRKLTGKQVAFEFPSNK
jgi:small subunit ribosomal protein S7e